MSFLDLQDFRLHYEFEERPDAEVLVFSHSLGADLSMWLPQMDALRQRFSILRYDSRGHGASSVSPSPYTVELLSRDALALLDGLGLEQVHFCGLSLGGMVGQWLGIYAADRLKSLILCNTAAQLGTASTWNDRIAAVQQQGIAAIAPGVLERWYTPSFHRASPDEISKTSAMLLQTDPTGYMASAAAVRDMDLREDIKRIKVPTLIIFGMLDPVTTEKDAAYLNECIAGSRLLGLQAAHLSNVEAADDFNRGLLSFLKGKTP